MLNHLKLPWKPRFKSSTYCLHWTVVLVYIVKLFSLHKTKHYAFGKYCQLMEVFREEYSIHIDDSSMILKTHSMLKLISPNYNKFKIIKSFWAWKHFAKIIVTEKVTNIQEISKKIIEKILKKSIFIKYNSFWVIYSSCTAL